MEASVELVTKNNLLVMFDESGFPYKKFMELGHGYNEKVASVLNNLELDCYCPELAFAKDWQEVKEMTVNEKDVVFTKINGHLEVKSRALKFTSDPQSFPYGTLMVDTVSGYEQKLEKPLAYVIVSQHTNDLLVIPNYTYEYWTQETKYDPARNLTDTFYLCPRELVKPFPYLVDYLRFLQNSSEARKIGI